MPFCLLLVDVCICCVYFACLKRFFFYYSIVIWHPSPRPFLHTSSLLSHYMDCTKWSHPRGVHGIRPPFHGPLLHPLQKPSVRARPRLTSSCWSMAHGVLAVWTSKPSAPSSLASLVSLTSALTESWSVISLLIKSHWQCVRWHRFITQLNWVLSGLDAIIENQCYILNNHFDWR